jgi:zinc protease
MMQTFIKSHAGPLIKSVALSLLVLLLLPSVSVAMKLSDQVFETRLSNGLKVILLENRKAPIVTFQVWYLAGSRNERLGKTGLSHVLEHMMFKGTEKVKGSEFTKLVQMNGGEYNAFTSNDFAGYFETFSSDKVDLAIELESDRMQNLILKEEDFQTERMVVMEERRLRTDDNPQRSLMEAVNAAAFKAQPYQWPVIGWEADLTRLTLEDVQEYYRRHYHPGNSFIVVVGDFKRDELLAKVEKAFGSIPRGPEMPEYRFDDPPQSGEIRVTLEREANLPFMVAAYNVPTVKHPDNYVLDVIASLLTNGESSRLKQGLVRRDQTVLEVDAENSSVSIDPSLFTISLQMLPDKDVATVEQALERELERLRREPVGPRELEKAKNQLEASFVFAQDSLFYQAMVLAMYEVVGDWKMVDEYLRSIREVTPEDIQKVAAQYLVPKNRVVGILKPVAVPVPQEGTVPARPSPPAEGPHPLQSHPAQ